MPFCCPTALLFTTSVTGLAAACVGPADPANDHSPEGHNG